MLFKILRTEKGTFKKINQTIFKHIIFLNKILFKIFALMLVAKMIKEESFFPVVLMKKKMIVFKFLWEKIIIKFERHFYSGCLDFFPCIGQSTL